MKLRIADCGLRIAHQALISGKGYLPATAKPSGEAGRIGRAAAFMDCGGKSCESLRSLSEGGAKQDDDTALARPMAYKSKAASRPPHSKWWLTLILAAGLLPSPAFAQTRPAQTQAAKLFAPATQPAAIPPITFARGGQKIDPHILYVSGEWGIGGIGVFKNEVTLTAFGRVWAGPADVIQKSAGAKTTMTMPKVRVATVFAIVDRGKRVVGEVVVYPDRDVQWDANTILYSCGELPWFKEWAGAAGLPVKQIAPADLLPGEKSNVKALLILGPGQVGNDLSHVAGIAHDQRVSVLVLNACWFGDAGGPGNVAPPQMLGGLAEIAKQHWPQPLKFPSRRKCWPGIANRWAWIADGNGLPLVEELVHVSQPLADTRPVVLSYVPWDALLGRSESADRTFLALLSAAASAAVPDGGWRSVEFIYPDKDKLSAADRPVLLAAATCPIAFKYGPWRVHVLDMRGTTRLPDGLSKDLKALEPRISHETNRLLILGDDKMLDEWEWLKLDRTKKTINRPGVVWLSDDELPPSKDNQIRLMLKLTELGVPLVPPSQQEEKKQ